MRRFSFIAPDWEAVENPRRFKLEIRDSHVFDNAATVSVWDLHWDESLPHGNGLKEADVSITLSRRGVVVESSYKFDGEVRVSF